MADYVLTCSSTADLPAEYTREHDIGVIPYHFYMDGQEYLDDQEHSLPTPEFYDKMRAGGQPSTSMVNTELYADFFRKYLEEGKDVLHLEFSSGLSGSQDSALRAARDLKEEYPDRTVRIVDTLSASRGYGLVVYLTEEKKEEGATLDEAAAFAEEAGRKVSHWFAVESLEYLRRGGRLSRTSAFLGTMLNIKPVLAVNDEGKVVPVEKIRGRKKSIAELLNKMEADIDNPDGQTVFVGHGDAPEEAEYVAEEIRKRFPTVKDVKTYYIGPVVGSHTGPGTVSVHYLSKQRNDTKFQ